MLGYTTEQVEKMLMILNYSIHHHIKETKFAEEDRETLRELEDFLKGLLMEARVWAGAGYAVGVSLSP